MGRNTGVDKTGKEDKLVTGKIRPMIKSLFTKLKTENRKQQQLEYCMKFC